MSLPTPERVSALRELMDIMNTFSAAPALQPAPVTFDQSVTQLATDSAASSAAIARAVAQLGASPDSQAQDQAAADTLWTESLKQISRIQKLYNLPPLPFQSQPKPPTLNSAS